MNLQNLYTIIVDYKGGTYVSQVFSESIEVVLENWFENFDFSCISEKSNKDKIKKKIKTDIINEQPTPLKGLLNTWFVCLMINRKKYLHLNIILTQTTGLSSI